jgi:hypothetical protein|eukprot:COSAG03_NODE_340_length_8832_cov_7.414176_4_plen_83_part_00
MRVLGSLWTVSLSSLCSGWAIERPADCRPCKTPSLVAGVCAMYEQKLKAQNPAQRNISYDISDLFFFIDSLGDLSCLGVYIS